MARDYVLTNWKTDHGLPDVTVTSMVQTADGYLWIGTFHGLVRFDGLEFRVFHVLNQPELPHDGVVNLHLGQDGALWVSTLGGMVRKKGGKWERFGAAEGWAGNYVRTFAEAADGVLWCATFDGEIVGFRDGRFQRLAQPDGGEGAALVWVDGANRLNAIRGSNWRRLGAGLKWGEVKMPQTAEGIGGWGGDARGLWRVKGRRLMEVGEGRILSERVLGREIKDVWSVREDRAGTVWIASYSDGLHEVRADGRETHYGTAEGFPSNSVRFASLDREGSVWVGTGGAGLVRMRPRVFYTGGAEAGLPPVPVRSVAAAPEGVYAATYGMGLYLIRKEGTAGVVEPALPERFLHAVLYDRRGRLWCATLRKGLYYRDRGERNWRLATGTAGGPVEGLFEDSKGRIWIAASKRAFVYEEGIFKAVAMEGVSAEPALRCFGEQVAGGQIWAGGDDGLFRLEGERLLRVKDREGKPLPPLASILGDGEGLWLGSTTSGMLHYRPAEAVARGLGNRTQFASAGEMLTGGEWLWVCTNRGVGRMRRAELHAAMSDGARELSYQLFDESDGLPSAECPVWNQPVAAADVEGRFWFATLRGVASVEPKKARNPDRPIAVRFEEFSYVEQGGRGSQRTLESGEGAELAAGSSDVRVLFNAVSPEAPQRIHYSYRLLRDGQVVAAGRQAERELRFLVLDAGEYALEMRARGPEGYWSPEPQRMAFVVRPQLTERWVFRLGVLLLLAGGLAAALTWQGRRKLRLAMEEVKRQRAVAELESRLAMVLSNTSDAVVFLTREGAVTYLNAAAREILRLGAKETVEGLGAKDVFAVGFLPHFGVALEGALERGRWQGMGEFRREGGAPVPVWLSIVVHESEESGADFVSVIARDMTPVLEAQAAVRSSEEKFSRAFQASPVPMAIVRQGDLAILEVNEAFVSLLAPPPGRVLGATLPELRIWTEEKARKECEEGLQGSRQMGWREYEYVRPGGQTGVAMFAMEPIEVEGAACSLLVVRDITERRKAEETIRQAQKMESIGQLAGGVAHDFNNQLTVIQCATDRMVAEPGLPEGARGWVDSIVVAARQAAFLTRQLLAFSRRQVIQPRVLDLNEVVQESAAMMRSLMTDALELRLKLDEDAPRIQADAAQLHQVLVNLALNARDAMPDGGVLTIATERTGDGVRIPLEGVSGPVACLTVTDTGMGMSQAVAARVFEPFFTTKAPGRGTGLGLATVYGIVRQFHGAIEVQSRPGAGTTFRMWFPGVQSAAEAAVQEKVERRDYAGRRILLVEDQEAIREVAQEILAEHGYVVTTAREGVDALAVLEGMERTPDLLITDVIMPGMNGPQLCQALRERGLELPVLYLSGYSEEALAPRGVLPEQTNYLAKPFHAEALLEKVSQALEAAERRAC